MSAPTHDRHPEQGAASLVQASRPGRQHDHDDDVTERGFLDAEPAGVAAGQVGHATLIAAHPAKGATG